jgi:hypothetical protein
MYLGQAAPTGQTPAHRAHYQSRQQAGIDALLSLATPDVPSETTQEETFRWFG